MKVLYLACMRGLSRLEDLFCYTGLLACTFLTVAAVINRYWLHLEIMWINDLILYLYIPTGMCCIAATARADAHTSVDVFVDMLFGASPVGRKACKVFTGVLVLAIFVYFMPLAVKLFQTAWKYPEWGTLVRWFNTSWNREFLVICIALCALHAAHNLGAHILELRAMILERPAGAGGTKESL